MLAAPLAAAEEAYDSASTATPDQLSAARSAMHAIMFETGVYDRAMDALLPSLVPNLQARVITAIPREDLSTRGQEALDRFVTALPDHVRAELRTGGDELVGITAGKGVHLFSADDWESIAAFFSNPDAQSMMLKLASDNGDSVSPEERETARRFYATSAGQAYAVRDTELSRMMYETMDAQMPTITRRMIERLHQRLCDALADECPPELLRTPG